MQGLSGRVSLPIDDLVWALKTIRFASDRLLPISTREVVLAKLTSAPVNWRLTTSYECKMPVPAPQLGSYKYVDGTKVRSYCLVWPTFSLSTIYRRIFPGLTWSRWILLNMTRPRASKSSRRHSSRLSVMKASSMSRTSISLRIGWIASLRKAKISTSYHLKRNRSIHRLGWTMVCSSVPFVIFRILLFNVYLSGGFNGYVPAGRRMQV